MTWHIENFLESADLAAYLVIDGETEDVLNKPAALGELGVIAVDA